MRLGLRNGQREDRAWLFNLYEENLRPYIEETWGWDLTFQQNEFDTNLIPERFTIVTSRQMDVAAYLLKEKEDHLWLEMLIVDRHYQHQGIGSWIISHLAKQSQTTKSPLKLVVIKCNPALAFYLGLGFVIEAEDESFYHLCRNR